MLVGNYCILRASSCFPRDAFLPTPVVIPSFMRQHNTLTADTWSMWSCCDVCSVKFLVSAHGQVVLGKVKSEKSFESILTTSVLDGVCLRNRQRSNAATGRRNRSAQQVGAATGRRSNRSAQRRWFGRTATMAIICYHSSDGKF